MSHTVNKFIKFCERLKFAKGHHIGEEQPNKNLAMGTCPKWTLVVIVRGHKRGPPNPQNKAIRIEKHKYSSDEGKFCELHHVTNHNTGDCEVLKAQACKMCTNWETHRSKYGNCNKHNCNNNNNDSKKSKTCKEINAV